MTQRVTSIAMDGVKFGLGISYPAPGVIERIGPDWDWIWIDGQHGEIGYSEMLALVRTCDLIQRPAIVRVPWHEAGPIGMALDAGAAGVIVPCVDTPEQARAVVDAAKFPPLGKRSYGGRRVVDRLGRGYSDEANQRTLLIVQIESPLALENVDEIASIDGVDALFLGPDDMLLRRACSMETPRTPQLLRKDLATVVAACERHGKRSVMIGIGGEMLECCLSLGVSLIVAGTDVAFLTTGSRQAAEMARNVTRRLSIGASSEARVLTSGG